MSDIMKSAGVILAYVIATIVGVVLGVVISVGIISIGAWLA